MSKNQALLQGINPPLYTFGDLVQYTIEYEGGNYTYYCQVVHMCWWMDDPDGKGYWEYVVQQLEFNNGRFTKIHRDYDTVNEAELSVWQDSTELLSI